MRASLQPREAKNAREHRSLSAPAEVALPGRVLAVDYGRRRIGLAISDELRITARPLRILERRNRGDVMRNLRAVAREWNARLIVVGHPLNLDGTPGEMAEEAARFATRVRKELGIAVELVDERLTSWAADREVATPRRRNRAQEPRDHVAAAIFLRDYLEREHPHHRSTRPGKE